MRAATQFAMPVVSFVDYLRMICGLIVLAGLYYKLHGVHRPTAMKKATIKRRKRVIPAGEEEEMDGASQAGDRQGQGRELEKGSINTDGSVNLGIRRNTLQPMAIEPRPAAHSGHSGSSGHSHRQPSPIPAASDLAAYHQQSLRPRNVPPSLNDDNRLPPITSMAASGAHVDRESSISPASFLSPARKRSFSSTDNEPRYPEEGRDENPKRLSSIKSILNPPSQNGSRRDDRHDYSLPPLRSPGTSVASAPSPGVYSTRDPTPALSDTYGESEQAKTDRRVALQREAEKMREMLAAKERELLALGHD